MKIFKRNLSRSTFVVWEMKRNMSVVRIKRHFNILISGKIFKEMPDLVASETLCMFVHIGSVPVWYSQYVYTKRLVIYSRCAAEKTRFDILNVVVILREDREKYCQHSTSVRGFNTILVRPRIQFLVRNIFSFGLSCTWGLCRSSFKKKMSICNCYFCKNIYKITDFISSIKFFPQSVYSATLTEVCLCFFLSFKANARL